MTKKQKEFQSAFVKMSTDDILKKMHHPDATNWEKSSCAIALSIKSIEKAMSSPITDDDWKGKRRTISQKDLDFIESNYDDHFKKFQKFLQEKQEKRESTEK